VPEDLCFTAVQNDKAMGDVSSTKIRKALAENNHKEVVRIMGSEAAATFMQQNNLYLSSEQKN